MKKVVLGFGLIVFGLIALLNPAYAFERLNFGDGFISDNANIISAEHKQQINSFLWELHNRTTADIAVVTVNSLQGKSVESTAVQIGRTFKVGAKGKNNGVVLLVAPNERKARIEVGYGLETVLPNSVTRVVMDDYMVSNFKTGDYSKGIYDGSARLANIIAQSYGITLEKAINPVPADKSSSNNRREDIPWWAWPFVILGAFCRGSRRGHFGGGGGFGGSCGSSGSW